jgi:glycosyltransferase involved in cell wall biosynthesis
MKVLTWHVHGSYLWYLSHVGVEWYLPVRDGRPEGYGGRSGSFAWPDNVHEIRAGDVRDGEFDLVLTQSLRNWEVDRHEVLAADRLRTLPRIHLEHDPPKAWPNEARHPVHDPAALLVHVTPFNALMWDSGRTPSTVVEHGVVVPDGLCWSGRYDRGISVVNNLGRRGRRLGPDVFRTIAAQVPLDLAGMNSDEFPQGIGDIGLADLHRRLVDYRFFLNPIRYTSLGLAVCEAMALGLPVLGLATTEMATAVENGVNGYVETDPARLVEHARRLLADPGEAAALSAGASKRAAERFGIDRFVRDWEQVLTSAAAGSSGGRGSP